MFIQPGMAILNIFLCNRNGAYSYTMMPSSVMGISSLLWSSPMQSVP